MTRSDEALDAAADRELDTDRRFFSARPWRSYRVRPTGPAEEAQIHRVSGRATMLSDGMQMHTAVRKIGPKIRARVFFQAIGGFEIDVGEERAKGLFQFFNNSQLPDRIAQQMRERGGK